MWVVLIVFAGNIDMEVKTEADSNEYPDDYKPVIGMFIFICS